VRGHRTAALSVAAALVLAVAAIAIVPALHQPRRSRADATTGAPAAGTGAGGTPSGAAGSPADLAPDSPAPSTDAAGPPPPGGAGQVPAAGGGTRTTAKRAGTPNGGTTRPAAPAPAGPPTAASAAFRTVVGPFCPQSGSQSTDVWNDPHGDGWATASANGWTGNSCGSSFLYTRLANTADPNQWMDSVEWVVNTGLSSGATCTIGIYIPNSGDATATGHYWVSNGSTDYDDGIAYFTIAQSAHRGTWLTAGTYHFTGRKILVELDDNGPGTTTMAASDLSVSC
jgi:hypothetical protein